MRVFPCFEHRHECGNHVERAEVIRVHVALEQFPRSINEAGEGGDAGIVEQDIDVSGISISVDEETALHPERIARLLVDMKVGADATDRERASLERVAAACKITKTLERSAEIELDFSIDA